MTVPGDVSYTTASERGRSIAHARAAVVGMYRNSGLPVPDFCMAYNDGCLGNPVPRIETLSTATLYRWVASAGQGIGALIPRYSSGTTSKPGTSLSEAAKSYLQYFYLRESRPSIMSTWREMALALPEEEASYQTARRYLESLPKVLVDAKRWGASRMDESDLPHIERNMALYKAMDCLVSDHHCFDFLVEKDGHLLRPWITAVQDFRSSKIVGFCPSVYPSSLSITLAFYLAVSRFGACFWIHIDNGKDYRSYVMTGGDKTMRVANQDGISRDELIQISGAYAAFANRVTFARPYHGASKGRMERTFGTFAQLFSKRVTSGYLGSNTVERPADAALYWRSINKKAMRTDIWPWSEFVRGLAAFIDWWNASWRGEGAGMDGRTPDEVFAQEAQPIRPVAPDTLALAFSRKESRRVGRNGVRLDGVSYYDDALLAYIGSDVLVCRMPTTPEEVLVMHPKGGRIATAVANYFLESGDLAADSQRVARAKRTALDLVKDSDLAASLSGPVPGFIQIARNRASEREPLALAAGGETDPVPAGLEYQRRADRIGALIDVLTEGEE